MKAFRFHAEARLEYLLDIDWYRERSADVSGRFTVEVESVVKLARTSPLRFPVCGYGARRVIVDNFPYSVIYRDTPHEIQTIAIAHAKRRPGYWRKRSF